MFANLYIGALLMYNIGYILVVKQTWHIYLGENPRKLSHPDPQFFLASQ